MSGIKQKRRNMTILFIGGEITSIEHSQHESTKVLLLNRDKKTIVNLMEELDFEERLAVIKEIISSDPV